MFDEVGVVPEVGEGEGVWQDDDAGADGDDAKGGVGEMGDEPSKWRTTQPKRILLATLDDDSTVVYYIVHDGVVKPRQN